MKTIRILAIALIFALSCSLVESGSTIEAPVELSTRSSTDTLFSPSNANYSDVLNARGELPLTAYHGLARKLTLPESIDGFAIAEIGAGIRHDRIGRSPESDPAYRRLCVCWLPKS